VVGVDKDQAWQVIHQERAALADMLETLTPEEWEHPSLCAGWSVRDVAAHVISAPEARVGQMAAALVRARGSFNRAAHDETQRLSRRPTGQIVHDYRRLAGSRRLAPGTNHRQALLDILVHTQDIAIPLGRHHEMPVEAARASAEAFRNNLFPFNARRRLAGCRLEATDIDWAGGEGAVVRGPIAALLLLITGRPAALPELTGDGVPQLRQRLEVRS
jgi:uncharacterized protein (TIGR03083 family)